MRIERGAPYQCSRVAVPAGWVFTHMTDAGKLSNTRYFVPTVCTLPDTGQLVSIKYRKDTGPVLAVSGDQARQVQVVGYGAFVSTGTHNMVWMKELPPAFSLLRSRNSDLDVLFLGVLTNPETNTNLLLFPNGSLVMATTHELLAVYRLVRTNCLNLVTI